MFTMRSELRRVALLGLLMLSLFASTAPVVAAPARNASPVQGAQPDGAAVNQYPVTVSGVDTNGDVQYILTDILGRIIIGSVIGSSQVEGTTPDGSPFTDNPVVIGGKDGSGNAQDLLTDTSGRSLVAGAAAAGAAVAGNPLLQGISDGTNAQRVLSVSGAVNSPGTGIPAAGLLNYDGTNWQPQRSGHADGLSVGAFAGVIPVVFNGASGDRTRGANTAAGTTGTGLLGAGALSKIGANWEADVSAVGVHANAWSAAAVGAGGTSTAVDCQQQPFITAFGNSSAATTISLQVSQDNTNFYTTQVTQVLAGAGDFVLVGTIGARYARLLSSGAATITATIAGKGG